MSLDPDKIKLQELSYKWLKGTLSQEEQMEFDNWFIQEPIDSILVDENIADSEEVHRKYILQKINQELKLTTDPKIRSLWPRIAVAVSIIICLSTGGFFIFHKHARLRIVQTQQRDIPPGHNQATLTLANGKTILLTKGLNGLLARQGQTSIHVSQSDITYINNQKETKVSYNTLTTARGEQSPYPLILADGTKVWLNAESSITFPTAFNQKYRIVKITGEALFEVAHKQNQPFKVQAANQTIEDIGTQFDINSYRDEPTSMTTLIEGSVKVNNIILKPGEQSDGKIIKPVAIANIIAWKNGDFNFENEKITTIMRQLARWYDIDVNYQGLDNTEGFNAQISRHQNISVILSALERTNGVRFKVEGRRVTVIQ